MKQTTLNSSQTKRRTTRRFTGRLKTWTMLALTAGVIAAQTPAEAKIKWKHVLGIIATVGGVGVGLGGHPEIGVALIGLQGKLLTTAAIIANDTNIVTGPDVTPLGFRGLGSPTPSPAAMDAMLAMNCPDVPVVGTPNEQFFIQKANVFIALGRDFRAATNPVVQSDLLQQMSAALVEAADAYSALGLTNEVTQADWDAFKLDCVDGVAPAIEEDYLIACGLNPAQRAALNQFQSKQTTKMDYRVRLRPDDAIRRAAALLNRHNVGFADLLHEPIGDATLTEVAGAGGVQVDFGPGGGGAGGLAGVSITLPDVQSWDGYWSELDAGDTLPVGAFVESRATGLTLGSTGNGPLGSWRMTKLGTTNYAVTADFSPLGASNFTVMVFNGTNLVHTATNQNGNLAFVNGCVSDDHWGRPTPKPVLGGALTLRGPKDIQLGSGAFAVGDRISIVPENVPTILSFRSVSIVASGVPSLTLTNQTIPTASLRPLPIRWLRLGVMGTFGGCFPGSGYCTLIPIWGLDTTPVMLTHNNGLKLEFLESNTALSNVFNVSQPVSLADEDAQHFGYGTMKIRPGNYPVDYSVNPFGTVHLNVEAKDITMSPVVNGVSIINWMCDGVRVLQESENPTGPWMDMDVQVQTPTVSVTHPTRPKRFFRVRSRD